MSTGFDEPPFFESIYSGETVVSVTRKPLSETRIPSPAKENKNNGIASPRNHVPILPLKTIFMAPKTVPKTPLRQNKANLPLGCVSNGRKQVAFVTSKESTAMTDEQPQYSRCPRPIYRKSELVAARVHELMADMSFALEIIIKNSPAKRPRPHGGELYISKSRRRSSADLDDVEFACEFGLEQYREGFGRRSMLSEPTPVKMAERAVEDVKKELKIELRNEVKEELKEQLEAEVREMQGELYEELAELASHEGENERHVLEQSLDSLGTIVLQGTSTEHQREQQPLSTTHRNRTCADLGRRKESMSIQDMVKGLRDDMSDVEDYEDAVEDRAGPMDPALAKFLEWRASPRSDSSSSVYSQ